MVEVKVAAELEAAVVVGVLQEGVEVEVFESAFVAKAEAKVECVGLTTVSTLRAKKYVEILTSAPSMLPNGGCPLSIC